MSTPAGAEPDGRRQYEELILILENRGPTGCRVRVAYNSLYKAGAHHDQFVYSREQLRQLTRIVEDAVRQGARHGLAGDRDLARAAADGDSGMSPADVGDWLFHSLFAGEVAHALHGCLGFVKGHPGRGLRLLLMFDSALPDLAEIAALPWELLRDAASRNYLALESDISVVRYLQVGLFLPAAELLSRLRILVVVAQPAAAGCLALEHEKEELLKPWRRSSQVEVEVLDHATPERLGARLAAKPFHVLHFMGHGTFDGASGQGCLLLENEDGGAAPLPGPDLSQMLKSCRSLRLVVLNACSTAQVPHQENHDPFAGVATALLMGGLPAVVAMRLPVSDRAAVAFTRSFYRAMAERAPVDAAVAHGRRAIFASCSGSWEWATPVVYMSVPDGRILAALDPPPAPGAMPEARGQVAAAAPGRPGPMRTPLLGVLCMLVLAAVLIWGWPYLHQPRDRQADAAERPGQAIEAKDAARHLNEEGTVCGVVREVAAHEEALGGPTFITFGNLYPNQDFSGVIWHSQRGLFAQDLESDLTGRNVCLTGSIELYRGKPEIILKKASQLVIPLR